MSIYLHVRGHTRGPLGSLERSARPRHRPGATTALERHYRPDELAGSWGLSVKVIREIFSNEPGVLKENRPETRNKRVTAR